MDFLLWLLTEDRRLADRWYRLFSRESWKVQVLHSLESLEKSAQSAKGMALAEIGLPGLKTPRELQNFAGRRADISILVFSTRDKIDNSTISQFLEAGADDFITPEIDERILLSKTRAHLRRLLPSLTHARTVILSKNGNVELDRVKRAIKTGIKSGTPGSMDNLTPKEFEILALLLGSEDRVIPRNRLMDEVWKDKAGRVNVETIDKHVETLRHKLGHFGKNIRTIYGVGYMYKSE